MKKDNSGVLFKNDRKESDKHPDFTGHLDVDGKSYWLSGWKNTGQKGEYTSLKVKLKDPIPSEAKQEMTYAKAKETPSDDEIPF